jgi:murein DD-endopeptidase MepM/ murein hydrolase activator NlpD
VVAPVDQTASQTTDQTAADAGTFAGDGSIYNVMQAVNLPPGAAGFKTYVVVGGDNLKKIGSRYGLLSTTIYWANTTRLADPSSLRVGQKLLIPPIDGVVVSVKAGATLSAYASKYKSTVQKIVAANGLSGSAVTVGQTLIIPCSPPPIAQGATGCQSNCGSTGWSGGKLRWPVPASRSITQYFSSRHPAIDIGAPTGDTVIAAVGGKVIWAGWKYSGPGYGGGIEVWILSSGKLWTTYNHLSAEYVRVGQMVSAGQRIGAVGRTGNATGPHLHFEVWVCSPWTGGGTSCARNPLRYL